jgi:hypothetical protein
MDGQIKCSFGVCCCIKMQAARLAFARHLLKGDADGRVHHLRQESPGFATSLCSDHSAMLAGAAESNVAQSPMWIGGRAAEHQACHSCTASCAASRLDAALSGGFSGGELLAVFAGLESTSN